MKVALFVEGLTELEFVKSLITELCGARGIAFEIYEQYRGNLVLVKVERPPGASTHILIADCHSDDQVKTQIRDQYPSLVAAGYSHVIGLRDVYPLTGC
jgi:hypothetical protein